VTVKLEDVLAAIQAGTASLPKNDELFSYAIRGFDGSPYITRTLLPREGDHRTILHRIHRADFDRHLHNHPWSTARFMILSGGYVEERLVEGFVVERELKVGDANELDAGTFHRISRIEPNTWTVGVVGPRVQEWGFLVDGKLVEWRDYFASVGHPVDRGASLS
jgi:hypothetical protein